MKRKVVGSYAKSQEAVGAVKELQEKGYQKQDITLICSTEARNSISNTTDVEITTDEAAIGGAAKNNGTDHHSIWERIKATFPTNDYDDRVFTSTDDDPLYAYQKDLANGNIIVMVNIERKKMDLDEAE